MPTIEYASAIAPTVVPYQGQKATSNEKNRSTARLRVLTAMPASNLLKSEANNCGDYDVTQERTLFMVIATIVFGDSEKLPKTQLYNLE